MTPYSEIHQLALTLLPGRLERIRSKWPTLGKQLRHAEFTGTLLAALWHAVWEDNRADLDLLIQMLPVPGSAHVSADSTAGSCVGSRRS